VVPLGRGSARLVLLDHVLLEWRRSDRLELLALASIG
jgi:hypothetical protein